MPHAAKMYENMHKKHARILNIRYTRQCVLAVAERSSTGLKERTALENKNTTGKAASKNTGRDTKPETIFAVAGSLFQSDM